MADVQNEVKVALSLLSDVEQAVENLRPTEMPSVFGIPISSKAGLGRLISGREHGEAIRDVKLALERLEAIDSESATPADRQVIAEARAHACSLRAQINLFGRNLPRDAVKDLRRAIASHNVALYHYQLGLALAGVNKAEARTEFETASSMDPGGEIGISAQKELSRLGKGPCLVATAATGSPASWEVLTLADFRDRVLTKSKLGRALVRSYYATSPSLARLIAPRDVLRSACLWLIVRPAARLARLLMR